VVVIGEGPGREEDATGRPFVGRAGRLLDELLQHAGLSRGDVYITNVLKDRATRPGAPPRDRPPAPAEVQACRPWLESQLGIIRPRVIVTLGRHSLGALLPRTRLADVHGRVQHCGGRTILPLYHPSYALHNPAARPILFRDVLALRALVRAGGLR
jgi:DNA polymerase